MPPVTKTPKQSKQQLDPDATKRANRVVEERSAELDALVAERRENPTLPKFIFEEHVEKLKQAEPELPDETKSELSRIDANKDLADRIAEVKELLEKGGLSDASRTYFVWKQSVWIDTVKRARQQFLGGSVRQKGGTFVEQGALDIRQAEYDLERAKAAQREANNPIKKIMEKRGKNYKKKAEAKFDEILGEERFKAEQAKQPSGKPIALSPDHLVPLDKIANLPELQPLLDLYKTGDANTRREIRATLQKLGDLPENLVPMRSDANVTLKNARPWRELDAAEAATYGYSADDIRKMVIREQEMLETIKTIIAEAVKQQKKVRGLHANQAILLITPQGDPNPP